MATNTPGSTARQNATQQTHYARIKVAYNDPLIAGGVGKQWLPFGAIITSTSVVVVQPFNGGTTNVLTAGINASNYDNVFAAADVDEATAAVTNGIKPTGSALGPLAADSRLFVKYTSTGTLPTQGLAYIIVHYTPDNDL